MTALCGAVEAVGSVVNVDAAAVGGVAVRGEEIELETFDDPRVSHASGIGKHHDHARDIRVGAAGDILDDSLVDGDRRQRRGGRGEKKCSGSTKDHHGCLSCLNYDA